MHNYCHAYGATASRVRGERPAQILSHLLVRLECYPMRFRKAGAYSSSMSAPAEKWLARPFGEPESSIRLLIASMPSRRWRACLGTSYAVSSGPRGFLRSSDAGRPAQTHPCHKRLRHRRRGAISEDDALFAPMLSLPVGDRGYPLAEPGSPRGPGHAPLTTPTLHSPKRQVRGLWLPSRRQGPRRGTILASIST